jgi:3-(3-hydroxy-phenyl)propionate hydroxylase
MSAPVVVVGAGPVGCTAALALAERGMPVLLLEATSSPSRQSHASTFHPPTIEILAELQIGQALVERGRIARTVQYRDHQYGLLAEFPYSLLERETPYPFRLQVEQRDMTSLAYERLRVHPHAEVRFDAPVHAVRPQGNDAIVEVGGAEIRAPWVIAADGAKSTVRSSLKIEFEGSTYEMRYLTVMTSTELDQLIPGLGPVTYVSGGSEGIGILGLADHWRVVFRVAGGESDQHALNEQRIQSRLRNAVSDAVAHYSLVDRFIYSVHRRVAATFQAGPILLAGDAAHVNSPSGGMGMNSGIHDAYVFARAIAQEGSWPYRADIQACAAERRRVALEIVGARSDRNYRDIVETDADARAARRRDLSRIEADPQATKSHLMQSSMLDHAPRPGRNTVHG